MVWWSPTPLEGPAHEVHLQRHSGEIIPMRLSYTWPNHSHCFEGYHWYPRWPGKAPSQCLWSVWTYSHQTSHHLWDCRQWNERPYVISSLLPHETNTLLLDMVANQAPVLIEVPPPPGSTAKHPCQHYADGHIDDEGPSRTELAKWAVTFSVAEALPHTTPDRTSASASPATMPPTGEKKSPPVTWPKIYMQFHKTAAKDSDTIIISSSPEASPTPASKPKSCNRPLSINEETNVQLLHDDNSKKKGEEVNIFQRGPTLHHGRGAAFTSSLRSIKSEKPKGESNKAESKKPKVEAKRPKYKSNEFIFDSPSPPPSPPTTYKPATWPVPRWTPLNVKTSSVYKKSEVKDTMIYQIISK